jgi:hypothetical protein
MEQFCWGTPQSNFLQKFVYIGINCGQAPRRTQRKAREQEDLIHLPHKLKLSRSWLCEVNKHGAGGVGGGKPSPVATWSQAEKEYLELFLVSLT